jgi:hypothetical protein
MARIGAKITQADVARTLRAVRSAGMQATTQVVVRPDGSIVICPIEPPKPCTPLTSTEDDGEEIIL